MMVLLHTKTTTTTTSKGGKKVTFVAVNRVNSRIRIDVVFLCVKHASNMIKKNLKE